MELEELKKSWNALDEHLKDKEFIKEEELEKLIRHADKGIHAIARLNIKLILISLPILILFLAEVLLHNRLNPIYIIIIFAWIPALCWGIRMLMYYCMLFAMLCWGRRICVILAIISPIRQENLRI